MVLKKKDRELLTQGDLAGERHAHQHQWKPNRHKFDDLVQRKLQLQVVNPVYPVAVLQQGIR